MKEKIRRFMEGRYCTDALNLFLNVVSLVLLIIALIWKVHILTWIAIVIMGIQYYRTFSRNISKRTEENYKFCTLKDRILSRANSYKDMWTNRKQYHYYRCSKCHQKLRVPRGRGRIQISCPRCGNQFIKKS
jgi:DNA-directed RNA polymerase subunit RPC12/RpoP